MMEFFTHTYPMARKEHVCEFCHRKIYKGKRYSYESGKYDGYMFTRKLCPECNGMLAEYCNTHGYDEFDWWAVSDWLKAGFCCDCDREDECNIAPEICNIVKKKFPSEIPEKLYTPTSTMEAIK